MKKLVLAIFMVVILTSSKGRVAWYGEREFEESIQSLEQEGYTIKYIDSINERTLSLYDVLVVCLVEPSQNEKEIILNFVEEGGGLLIIYSVISHENIEDVLTEYHLENIANMETDIVFPFLPEDRIDELKRRIAVSQKGKGRIFVVGYDPLTFQTISLFLDVKSIFKFGMNWLCQEWHVKQTQQVVSRRLTLFIVPVIIVAALILGFYFYRKRAKVKAKKPEKPGSEKAEKIRELKARFVYGEVSREEYQRELESLEHSDT